MKKIFHIWVITSSLYAIIIPFLMSLIFSAIVIFCFEPIYINYIKNFTYFNVHLIYFMLGTIILFLYLLSMNIIFSEAIKLNYQLQYWLVLSKRELFLYLFLEKIHFYYIYMLMMLLFNGRLISSKILWFLAFSAIYMCVAYYIYTKKYQNIFIMNKGVRKIKQGFIDYSDLRWLKEYPIMELIFLGWYYRYASGEGILCKIAVMILGLFFLALDISNNIVFFLYFILFMMLTFIDDNFWKSEIKNAIFFKNMGISFSKYFLLNIISGTLFHSVLLCFIYGYKTQSFLGIITFFIITLFFVWYWTTGYLYLYLSGFKTSELIKQIFLLFMLIIEFIPFVNFFVGLYLLKKSADNWRRL